jgi:uracil-DNA glycosylase family 4
MLRRKKEQEEVKRVKAPEGPIDAALLLVGEQPGDQEDREGRPFVGPAGRILDLVLEKAGLDRGRRKTFQA